MITKDYLSYATSFQTEINLGLGRMNCLLKHLGNPQNNMKYIHVAGTNGKGSVCSFLETMLFAEGYKTGRFSSPELVTKNETIRVNKENISDRDLEHLLMLTESASKKVNEELGEYPSQFEIMCSVAFLYFQKKECDFCILEVGMGGLTDATNVIPSSEICILTQIAVDHEKYLGKTIDDIALVKSGIIKPFSKVVTTDSNEATHKIIKEKCLLERADFYSVKPLKSFGFEGIYEKVCFSGKEARLSMGGLNQLDNASLAIRAAELLNLSEKSIAFGLENSINEGRLEQITDTLYFDGAHNPNGIKALKENLDRYMPRTKKTFVMGVMADKDFRKMIKTLDDGLSDFNFVTIANNPRAMPAEEMKRLADKEGIKSTACKNISEALENSGNNTVIVCGSLYMYSHFIKEYTNQQYIY